MECLSCKFADNQDDAQFCAQCGASLHPEPANEAAPEVPAAPNEPDAAPVAKVPVDMLARASLIFGIAGIVTFGLSSLLGLFLGWIALRRVQNAGQQMHDYPLLRSGMVVSACVCILAAVLFPVFAKAREKARQTSCINNQRQLAVAILMYTQDNDEVYPPNWTVLKDYTMGTKIMDCPSAFNRRPNDYGFNAAVVSKPFGDIREPALLLVTADGGDANNMITTGTDITESRHGAGFVASYGDGHCGWRSKQEKVDLKLGL